MQQVVVFKRRRFKESCKSKGLRMRQVSQDVRCNMGLKGGGEGSGHWMFKELRCGEVQQVLDGVKGRSAAYRPPPQHEMRRATDAARGVIVLVSMTGAELTFNRNSHTGRRKG